MNQKNNTARHLFFFGFLIQRGTLFPAAYHNAILRKNREHAMAGKTQNNVRGVVFREMHEAAVKIAAAYASSANADPARIPELFREMLRVQRDLVLAADRKDEPGNS